MRLGRVQGVAAGPTSAGNLGARAPADGGGALLGSWSATRWQYTSRTEPPLSMDVVCDLGGTVTLSLSAGTYVLTYDVARRGSRSQGGSCALEGNQLQLTPEGSGDPDVVQFRIASETLSLTAESSAWDFDNDGEEEAADFVAVLVRL